MPDAPDTFKQRLRAQGGMDARDRGRRLERGADDDQADVDRLRNSRRWRRLRAMVLRDEPLCRACAAVGRTREATQVDHIVPLRARPDLAYTRSNLQPLCVPHHAAKSGQESRGIWPDAAEDAGPMGGMREA